MSSQILYSPKPGVFGERKTMHFQVAIPESCSSDVEKINNFRKHIAELEAELKEVDKIASRFELVSKAKIVSAIIMESSISFLDLAANIFKPINPAASNAAGMGVSVIRTTKDTGELMNGQKNGGQFVTSLGQNALNFASSTTTFGSSGAQIILGQAKTQMGVISLAVEQASGSSKEDMQKEVWDFTKDASRNVVSTIQTGAADSGMKKTAGVLAVFGMLDGVYQSMIDYDAALEKHFNERIEDQIWVSSFRHNQKAMLKNVITTIEKALRRAEVSLDACISENTQKPMSPIG